MKKFRVSFVEIKNTKMNSIPPIYLNTTGCQYTDSKTQRAMRYIKLILDNQSKIESENGVHHLSILMNNNSLLETRQWKTRLLKNDLRINILSSHKKSCFKTYNDFVGFITNLRKPDELMDVLVMCNNNSRDDDLFKILENFERKSISIEHLGIHRVIIKVMYDEVDKVDNLNLATNFIKRIQRSSFTILESIHLITATPYVNFWKKLKKNNDIEYLTNITSVLEVPPYYETYSNYCTIDDHDIIFTDEITNCDPIPYFKKIFEKYLKKKRRVICYCPTSRLTKIHSELSNFLLSMDNNIVIEINHKVKGIYIGNKDNFIDIDTFNIENNISNTNNQDIEMYETLKCLSEKYPTKNIFINGYNCISRGITLQTEGFNFTDVIIPFINCIAELIQITGRMMGGKNFIRERNTIYIHKTMYEKIKHYIEYSRKIEEDKPEVISGKNFREITKRDIELEKYNIPECFSLSNEQYNKMIERKSSKSTQYKNKTWLIELIQENGIDLSGYPKYEKDWYFSGINTKEGGWEKVIKPFETAYKERRKYGILKNKYKQNEKNFGIYVDAKHKQIYISKYNETF